MDAIKIAPFTCSVLLPLMSAHGLEPLSAESLIIKPFHSVQRWKIGRRARGGKWNRFLEKISLFLPLLLLSPLFPLARDTAIHSRRPLSHILFKYPLLLLLLALVAAATAASDNSGSVNYCRISHTDTGLVSKEGERGEGRKEESGLETS